MKPLRVAIVDDHPMFRMGLAVAIGEMDGIELVGEADDAEQVETLVASTAPDLVLLDVRLGDASGLEVNRWLAEHHPSVKVIMLTMSEDHDTALTALRDGACGYLVKGAGPERVEHALRGGGRRRRRARPRSGAGRQRARPDAPPPLEPPVPGAHRREFGILELVAEGLDNHAIARRLVLSPKTVRNHVSNVMTKINVVDRPHAIVLSRRLGLGETLDQ